MSLLLAIDQSTSATKAILFDSMGRAVDRASLEHQQLYPQPGWVEHDADEIWKNTCSVVQQIAARHDLGDLAGLSITNQRETIVAFDKNTGRPLYHAIVWQCRRGERFCRMLRERGHEELVRARTGLRIDAYFSGSKAAWLVDHEPHLARKLRDGSAALGTVDSYLVHRLTRGKVLATDSTNACRTLLFDAVQLCWSVELCEIFGIPRHALPEVRESAARFGETDVEGILPRSVPIIGVMGDSQASLFAQRCYRRGSTKATFGSGSSVLTNMGPTFKLHAGTLTTLAWVWKGKPTYALEGLVNFSAATITWMKNQLGLIQDESEVEPLALAVPDNGGVYLVPAFSGLGAPHHLPLARAAILGMSAFTRREHVVRAAVESIGYQLRDVVDAMRSAATIAIDQVQADGGASRNEALMQFTADITGLTLGVADLADSSAWGAAMMALLGLGTRSSLEELAALPHAVRHFTPRMEAAEVKRLHEGWLDAVNRVS